MTPRTIAVLLPALLLASVRSARADGSSSSLADQRLNLAVPDVPAFTALGVSPSTISRPDNVKDLAAAVASGIGRDGTVQSGVAIEVSPVKLFANAVGSKATAVHDALGGLRISGATNSTSASSTDDSHTYAAVGFRYSLGGYHPETDTGPKGLEGCLTNASVLPDGDPTGQPPPPPPPPPVTGAAQPAPSTPISVTTDPLDITKNQQLPKCRSIFRARHLAADLSIEIAGVHTESAVHSAKLSDFHPDTNTAWVAASFARGTLTDQVIRDALARNGGSWAKTIADKELQDRVQHAFTFAPILFGRVDSKRIAPSLSTDRQTDVYLAARLPLLADGWSLFVEAGYKWIDVGGKLPTPPKDSAPAGLGADLQLGNGTWLGLYAGADLMTGAVLSLGNVKWTLGETRPY